MAYISIISGFSYKLSKEKISLEVLYIHIYHIYMYTYIYIYIYVYIYIYDEKREGQTIMLTHLEKKKNF